MHRRKGAAGRADDLFSKLVRSRGFCEGPGTRKGAAVIHTQNLQCAHILGRRLNLIRTDLDNALCLCAGCHYYFTNRPEEWRVFIDEKFGAEHWYGLYRKAHVSPAPKVDWKAEVERLTALLAEVER